MSERSPSRAGERGRRSVHAAGRSPVHDLLRGLSRAGAERLKKGRVALAPRDSEERSIAADRTEVDRDVHLMVAQAPRHGEHPPPTRGRGHGALLEQAEKAPLAVLLDALVDAALAPDLDARTRDGVFPRPGVALPALRPVVVLVALAARAELLRRDPHGGADANVVLHARLRRPRREEGRRDVARSLEV